jgi:hypothetical protein
MHTSAVWPHNPPRPDPSPPRGRQARRDGVFAGPGPQQQHAAGLCGHGDQLLTDREWDLNPW